MLYYVFGYFVVTVQILVSGLIVYLAVKTLLTRLGFIKEPLTLEQVKNVNEIVNKFFK